MPREFKSSPSLVSYSSFFRPYSHHRRCHESLLNRASDNETLSLDIFTLLYRRNESLRIGQAGEQGNRPMTDERRGFVQVMKMMEDLAECRLFPQIFHWRMPTRNEHSCILIEIASSHFLQGQRMFQPSQFCDQ